MAAYNFSRELVDGKYNVNNQYCTDGSGNKVTLATEIQDEATLPNDFKIICDDENGTIDFSITLDATQQAKLTSIIDAHKAHTGG